MRIRCSDPVCNEVIDFKQHYVHVEGQYFCSSDCCLHKLEADRRLKEVASPFYVHKKKRFQFAGGSDQEDWGDCDPQPHKPPLQV